MGHRHSLHVTSHTLILSCVLRRIGESLSVIAEEDEAAPEFPALQPFGFDTTDFCAGGVVFSVLCSQEASSYSTVDF